MFTTVLFGGYYTKIGCIHIICNVYRVLSRRICLAVLRFCQWYLEQCVRHPQFLWKLLLTDEAMFTRDGVFNFHNVRIWTHANPHAIRQANVDELWERIVATFVAIRNRPGQLERVRESIMRRLNGCVAANGQHFEHLI